MYKENTINYQRHGLCHPHSQFLIATPRSLPSLQSRKSALAVPRNDRDEHMASRKQEGLVVV